MVFLLFLQYLACYRLTNTWNNKYFNFCLRRSTTVSTFSHKMFSSSIFLRQVFPIVHIRLACWRNLVWQVVVIYDFRRSQGFYTHDRFAAYSFLPQHHRRSAMFLQNYLYYCCNRLKPVMVLIQHSIGIQTD